METYEVINTIDESKAVLNTIEEVRNHISVELEWFNFYEKGVKYDESDFIVNEITKQNR